MSTINPAYAAMLRANQGAQYVYSYLPQLKEVIPGSDPSGRHVWADSNGDIWSNLGVIEGNAYFGERTPKELMHVG